MTLEEFLKQVRQSSSQVQPGFGSWKKGNYSNLCLGERDMGHVRAGPDELPEQVQDHPGLGRSVQQARGELQPGGCH